MNSIDLPETAEEVPEYEESTSRPRLSLTSDILDFRKCNRKYGLYKVRGFDGSSPTAEFVGTFAHRSMEEAWQIYQEEGHPPANQEMVAVLERVRQDLLDEGRSPHSWPAVFHAGYQVLRMVSTMDALGIFDDIIDSERTFRSDEEDYVLEGVADMVLDNDDGIILWDFKSAHDPRRRFGDPDATDRSKRASRQMLTDYSLQLRLYHFLCESVLEQSPERCELVFLGELGKAKIDFGDFDEVEAAWRSTSPTPLSAEEWSDHQDQAMADAKHGLFYSVSNEQKDIEVAKEEFERTASEILTCRELDAWDAPDVSDLPSKQTCEDCDFLESCKPALSKRSNN